MQDEMDLRSAESDLSYASNVRSTERHTLKNGDYQAIVLQGTLTWTGADMPVGGTILDLVTDLDLKVRGGPVSSPWNLRATQVTPAIQAALIENNWGVPLAEIQSTPAIVSGAEQKFVLTLPFQTADASSGSTSEMVLEINPTEGAITACSAFSLNVDISYIPGQGVWNALDVQEFKTAALRHNVDFNQYKVNTLFIEDDYQATLGTTSYNLTSIDGGDYDNDEPASTVLGASVGLKQALDDNIYAINTAITGRIGEEMRLEMTVASEVRVTLVSTINAAGISKPMSTTVAKVVAAKAKIGNLATAPVDTGITKPARAGAPMRIDNVRQLATKFRSFGRGI